MEAPPGLKDAARQTSMCKEAASAAMDYEMNTSSSIQVFAASVARAIGRARLPIALVAATYAVSLLVGMVMAHTGNAFALNYRDQLVGQAVKQDAASVAAIQGDNLRAALLDFAGNLLLGAAPKTLSGYSVIFPFPMVAYQGWIGGIVSVRGDHSSRLDDPRSAVYYLLTLLLQLVPYSLAVGAGVNAGIALLKPPPHYQDAKWLGLFSKEALRDVGRIYALVIPLFLVASLWEFLSPWNI
ncbi:MAG: stage II sporulation protein M [Anaerolineales bacterium]